MKIRKLQTKKFIKLAPAYYRIRKLRIRKLQIRKLRNRKLRIRNVFIVQALIHR